MGRRQTNQKSLMDELIDVASDLAYARPLAGTIVGAVLAAGTFVLWHIGGYFELIAIVAGLLAGLLMISAGVGAIVGASRRRGNGSIARRPSPYGRKFKFLSDGERAFFHPLREAVGDRYVLFTKVRLGDLVFVASRAFGPRNSVDRKHIDFVLCDPASISPVLAIELDDRSHDRPDRKRRDEFVDEVLASAGLPILHVRAAAAYDVQALRQRIESKILAKNVQAAGV